MAQHHTKVRILDQAGIGRNSFRSKAMDALASQVSYASTGKEAWELLTSECHFDVALVRLQLVGKLCVYC